MRDVEFPSPRQPVHPLSDLIEHNSKVFTYHLQIGGEQRLIMAITFIAWPHHRYIERKTQAFFNLSQQFLSFGLSTSIKKHSPS